MRIYQTGTIEVQALQGLDLLVDSGEMIAVVGASGSGKSTLLSVLSGIDAPTAGHVRVGRWDLMAMSAKDRVRYRRSMVGFVWNEAGVAREHPYARVLTRLGSFFGNPRREIDVVSLHVFGYGRDT